jgi:hypothetical protein
MSSPSRLGSCQKPGGKSQNRRMKKRLHVRRRYSLDRVVIVSFAANGMGKPLTSGIKYLFPNTKPLPTTAELLPHAK